MKPSWKDAPEGARYLAQQDDGRWAWAVGGTEVPYPSRNGGWTNPRGIWSHAGRDKPNPNWKDTLEPRPTALPVLPDHLPELPEGYVYIGKGSDLKNHSKPEEYAWCGTPYRRWIRSSNTTHLMSRWADSLFYAVPTDSPFLQQLKESKMSKPYTIHQDGSVTYEGHTITADDAQALVNWYWSVPYIAGAATHPHMTVLEVGCKRIDGSIVHEFCKEYKAEKWKKPKGKEYIIGSKFKWGGHTYILARVDSEQVTFINTTTGSRFCEPIRSYHYKFKLSEFDIQAEQLIPIED